MTNDLISREALKKEVKTLFCPDGYKIMMLERIDNAPSVEAFTEEDMKRTIKENFDIGYEMAKAKYERPQGECKKCDYYRFSQAFINGIVELVSKNGITTIDELLETLKGGKE